MAESAKKLAKRYRREAKTIARVADVLDPPKRKRPRRRQPSEFNRELRALARTSPGAALES